MSPATIYLDMDGVVADFDAFLQQYRAAEKKDYDAHHHTLFRTLVKDEQVFARLDKMEGCDVLVQGVRDLQLEHNLEVYFLTSVGTKDPEIGTEVAQLKKQWLADHGLEWKPLFVTEKKFKAKYADKYSILVDDRPGCVEPFREAGGRAILHKDPLVTLESLDEHLKILEWS